MLFDIDHVRSQFPALASGVAYFDNAGGSLVLKRVAARIADYLLTTSVQLGASYATSELASSRVAQARSAIAGLVNAARDDEIVFGPSSTVLLQNLARAMASQLSPGDEIVVTAFDHESNRGPWRALAAQGIVIREWDIDPGRPVPDLEALEALIGPRTKLVAVTQVSNILGTILPVADIARRVHALGARLCVDGVAFAPHRAVNVTDWDVDYYVFSFYKTFGPHFAALYVKHDFALELDSLYHFHGREALPAKLEPGNTNFELAWGAGGIVDYLREIGGGGDGHAAIDNAFDAIAAYEEALCERFLSWLRGRGDVRIIGHSGSSRTIRVPTISFDVPGRPKAALVRRVDAESIGIRHGEFHSRRLIERLGLAPGGGVLRVSMAHYNTMGEVDRLVESLDRALGP